MLPILITTIKQDRQREGFISPRTAIIFIIIIMVTAILMLSMLRLNQVTWYYCRHYNFSPL